MLGKQRIRALLCLMPSILNHMLNIIYIHLLCTSGVLPKTVLLLLPAALPVPSAPRPCR
jgi:hypothetical protein